jgi:hypothetical protein
VASIAAIDVARFRAPRGAGVTAEELVYEIDGRLFPCRRAFEVDVGVG